MLGDYTFQLAWEQLENIAEDKDIDMADLLTLVPLNMGKQLKTGWMDGLQTVCSLEKMLRITEKRTTF